jgi:hypothetical protein
MARYLRGINILRAVGGDPVADNVSKARSAPQHIVVGTPGRVQHMIEEKVFVFDRLRLFVLDEADEMLSQGFKEIIVEINHYLPPNAQTILLRFSLFFSLQQCIIFPLYLISSLSPPLCFLSLQCHHAPSHPPDFDTDPPEPRANPGSSR